MEKVLLPISSIRCALLDFSVLWEIKGETNAFPMWWSIPSNGNLMVKNTHIMEKLWEPISHTFSLRGVLLPFYDMGNQWENACISHVMKHTMGWEPNGEKAPILFEKYGFQFPSFSPYNRFCCIFLCYEKLMVKPMYFLYNDVYHRMGIEWSKSIHTMGKAWITVFHVVPIKCVFLHFPVL